MSTISDFLVTLIAVIVSAIIFNIILNALNQSMLKLFVPLQKLVSKIKQNKLLKFIKFIIFIICILLCVTIKDFYKLNNIEFGILIGFFNSLTDVIFETEIISKKKM